MGPTAPITRTETAWGRRGGVAALAALLVLAAGFAASSPADPTAEAAAPVNVGIRDNFFKPAKATVRVGGKVKWTNKGGATHNVTFNSGFESGNLAPGETTVRRFKRAGKFAYVCTLHSGMKGVVKAVK